MKNILYIHTHDTGRFTSVYGKNVPTPHLKAFAEDALVFRNAFCASPTCSPSRGAMLTGRYPHENGLVGLAHRGFSIKDKSGHLAAFLQRNGFETVLCGVQHEEKGYDYTGASEKHSRSLGYEKNISYFIEDGSQPDKEKADRENAMRAAAYLRAYSGGKPFFLSYGMFHTHRPYPELTEEERKEFRADEVELPRNVFDSPEAREDTACLYKSLKRFDENFQIVIDALKEAGLYDSTIILSTTDHGLANPFSKCTLTDDGMGVSLIMRIPDCPESFGRWHEGLVSHIDVFPTLCEAEGLEPPENLSGVSLLPVFRDTGRKVRDQVFGEINFHTSFEPARCVRTERYKYIRYYDETWKKYNMTNCDDSALKSLLVDAGWRQKTKASEWLFDLYFDPCEKNNVAEDPEYADVVREMRGRLEEWRKETNDHIMTPEEYMGHCKLNRKDDLSPTVTSPEQLESSIQ